jgi:hypothetical protein
MFKKMSAIAKATPEEVGMTGLPSAILFWGVLKKKKPLVLLFPLSIANKSYCFA